MGNSIARDFKNVQLGKGSVPDSMSKELIAPGSVVLDSPMTILLRKDEGRKSTIIFDADSMMPMYIVESKRKKKEYSDSRVDSVTKDRRGRKLFLTMAPSKNERLIYKAPKKAASKGGLDDLDSSNHSTSSVGSAASLRSSLRVDTDVPAAAKIDVDRSGASTKAFFSVVVWKGSGPEMMPVYKGVKIDSVKYGALVADNMGAVVAKAKLDEQRMEPKLEIASGADVPAVVATITALYGDF